MTVRPGTVYLVGAGPGDPGLITVRGLELLRRADIVLHDRLVSAALLEEIRSGAELIDVGKTPLGRAASQASINAALVEHARSGRTVVRLKGGDPLIFGRGWEVREACVAANVPCEIVPGVTSALAGPAAAGIPVTLRGVASSVAIMAAPVVDEEQLRAAAHAGTCVFLMGVRELPTLARRLIECGHSASTPAAVIERATLPGQRTLRGRLDGIARAAADAGLRSPAIIVVGQTAALGAPPPGPLSGRRIVVTRPRHAAHELTQLLSGLGAEVVEAPLIRIAPVDPAGPNGSAPLARAKSADPTVRPWYDRIEEFDWLVFTSRHGVRGFRRAIEAYGGDVRRLARARIAVVGPVTARELLSWGLTPDLQANPARAEVLVNSLLELPVRPRRVLFPCGTLALDTVPEMLGAQGIDVERVTVYETRLLSLGARTRASIERGVDAVLLASPSAVTALGRSRVRVGDAAIVCIGPTTAAATSQFGWANLHVAERHSDAGMVDALVSALGLKAQSQPQSQSRSCVVAQ